MVSDKEFRALKSQLDRIYEDSQILAGTRNENVKQQSAVRRSDLAVLENIQFNSKSAAGSTPTQAEFDALVSDVQAIATVLSGIARSLK